MKEGSFTTVVKKTILISAVLCDKRTLLLRYHRLGDLFSILNSSLVKTKEILCYCLHNSKPTFGKGLAIFAKELSNSALLLFSSCLVFLSIHSSNTELFYKKNFFICVVKYPMHPPKENIQMVKNHF